MMIDYAAKPNGAALFGGFPMMWPDRKLRSPVNFERINFRVNVEADAPTNVVTEATVKLRIDGQMRHEVAEGDGPVNALDAALRKALNGHFPNLAQMKLVDYKVRVINSEGRSPLSMPLTNFGMTAA